MKIVDKPWGREEWLELNDRYCCKRIYINKGYRTSYQYHNHKVETNCLISGTAELWLENDEGIVEKKIIKGGDFFNVHPPKKHRLIALSDLILYEASTPEVDDVFRIQDDSNRGDGKINTEHTQVKEKIILSDLKDTDEITYRVDGRVFKFNPNKEVILRLYANSQRLKNFLPQFIEIDDFTLSYKWIDGDNLYNIRDSQVYRDFLSYLQSMIESSKIWKDGDTVINFYKTKHKKRNELVIKKYGNEILSKNFLINGKYMNSLNQILSDLNLQEMSENPFYSNFHGDLHFKNIIYGDGFTLIDWRESFNGSCEGGDLYYDLAKLYTGCVFPFSLFNKPELITFSEISENVINYDYPINDEISQFLIDYKKFLDENNYDFEKIKKIAGLIFYQISPLHEYPISKIFVYKSIEILNEFK